MKRILLISVILAAMLLSACGTTTTAPAPAPKEPVMIKEWSGTGIKTTESFTITSQPWTIAWSSNPEIMSGMSVGILQIMVYDVRSPQIPITLAANTNVRATDTSYIYQTGTFYLTINAANTQWAVQVWAR